jgi:hypothetical protein
MKIYSLVFILLLIPFIAISQKQNIINPNRKYLGIGLVNTNFHIYFKNPKNPSFLRAGSFAPVGLNFGFKFNKRGSLQIGIAYGGHTNQLTGAGKDSTYKLYEYKEYYRTRAVAIPIIMRFIISNPDKRAPIYVVTSLMPAYGFTTERASKTSDNTTTTIISEKEHGINTFFTAGLGINYKIVKRFTGITELLLLKSNLSGHNSKYYDWRGEDPLLFRLISSVGLGINYNL